MPTKKVINAKKPLLLNLGCGGNKLDGYINIDVEPSVKPDVVHDFTQKPLPYKNGSVQEIVFFHTIEHIKKAIHIVILSEMHRVLQVGGKVYISYPNFWECAMRWRNNYKGKRPFWENTIFGLQRFPSDHHVCIMDPIELQEKMLEIGFINVKSTPERREPFNTITFGEKSAVKHYFKYEDLLKAEIAQTTVKRFK